jgi:hypothetical protein
MSKKTKATPKAKPSTKGKSKPEAGRLHGSRIVTGSLEVSLDNADTVIEGAPRLALFETWDAAGYSLPQFDA